MRLIYFSPVPWSSYAQRPHYMVRYFLEQRGGQVLWVNPYPTRLPRLKDFFRAPSLYDQQTPLPRGLVVLNVPAMPVEPLPFGARMNRLFLWRAVWRRIVEFIGNKDCVIGIGRPSALAVDIVKAFPWCWRFYDAMDDFPEFYRGLSKWSMVRRENQLALEVDTVFVSSSHLAGKFRRLGLEPKKLNNGCDMAAFPQLQNSHTKGAIFGYIGSMGDWFDWETVVELAKAFPNIPVKLVGPCFISYAGTLPGNIELMGPCSQPKSIDYLKSFTIGLIPFKVNRLTAGVDPIKYYEYRAMGLPVLSTRFGEMATRGRADGVFFFDEFPDLRILGPFLLEYREDAQSIQDFRQAHDWREKFHQAGLFA